MSASHSKHVTQGIREDSSVSEIISAIRYSFQEEEYDEAERVMANREKKLREELDSLKKACDTVTQAYGRASLEKLQAVEELLECKTRLQESSRQLKKLKEEKETMAEQLANKDIEVNQLKIEKNDILKDIVARVEFLNEDITNTLGVDAMRRTRAHYQGSPLETLPTIVGESGDQNFPKSGSSSNARGAENANLPLGGELPNGEAVLTSAQSSPHRNVGEIYALSRGKSPAAGELPNGEAVLTSAQSSPHHNVGADALSRGKSPAAGAPSTHVPLANQAVKPLEIIDITSDTEDESMNDSDDSTDTDESMSDTDDTSSGSDESKSDSDESTSDSDESTSDSSGKQPVFYDFMGVGAC